MEISSSTSEDEQLVLFDEGLKDIEWGAPAEI